MKLQPPRIVWPDPIVGYREFVDRTCRAVFEDSTGQYIMGEGERIYGTWMIPGMGYRLPVTVYDPKSR